MDEKTKKLQKMASWTTAIFATVFAVFMTLFWLFDYPINDGSPWQTLGSALSSGWLLYLIAAALCIAFYFGYKQYLGHRK